MCNGCWLAKISTMSATRHSVTNCGKEVPVTPQDGAMDVESVDSFSDQAIAASTSKPVTGIKTVHQQTHIKHAMTNIQFRHV
jgi:hypothetical protein